LSRPGGDELLGVLDDGAANIMKQGEAIVQEMRAAARVAMRNAYCGYSKFRVGAAVLTAGGEIFAGCNVENASYGLTMCAERNAIFQAVAKGRQKIKAVVVVTPTKTLTSPCGACRQVINEFGPNAEVFLFGRGGSSENAETVKS
jgi:cytidine deaminase